MTVIIHVLKISSGNFSLMRKYFSNMKISREFPLVEELEALVIYWRLLK